jgi:hypothetical protein
MTEYNNIIIVLDDGETYSGMGAILAISDEAMERMDDGAKLRHLDEDLGTTQWGRVIQSIGYAEGETVYGAEELTNV